MRSLGLLLGEHRQNAKPHVRPLASQLADVLVLQHLAGMIAVFTKDVADTKAKEATDLGKSKGFPLYFTIEPEE